MRNPVPIVLLVLVALSLPVSVVGTASGPAAVADSSDHQTTFQSPSVYVSGDHAQLDGTPNRLVLHGDRVSTYGTPTLDFGLAVAAQDDSIRSDYRSFTFETEFEELEDDANRSDAVVAELERLEERIHELRDREQDIVAAHADGEASETDVLRAVARNYHEAQELQRAIDRIDEKSGGAVDLSDPVRDFNAELSVYTSPIRTSIHDGVRGNTDADDPNPLVAIESAEDGLVLSTIDGNDYVREATRYDNRDLDQRDQVETMDRARDIAQQLYPWAFETNSGTSTANHDLIQLYTVQASSHDQGELSVYVDGGTGAIYHERQTLDLHSVPIETTDSMSTENVSATLERTPDTAPATITVTEPENETPIDATIVVDGTVVGETDDNGELWFIPPTDGFELSVQTESETLNATVESSR